MKALVKFENLTAHVEVDEEALNKGEQRVPVTIHCEMLKSREGFYFFTNQRAATIAGQSRTVGETFKVNDDMNLRVKLSISDSRRKFTPRQPEQGDIITNV